MTAMTRPKRWMTHMIAQHAWLRVLLYVAAILRSRRNLRRHWACIARETKT